MIDAIKGRRPGEWWPCRHANGQISATFYCQNCGKPMGLANHHINENGEISPSVVCPHPVYPINPHLPEFVETDLRCPSINCQHCDFHNYVKLIGWVYTAKSEGAQP